ncbi:MAG: energy transducer TonB [Rhodocyclaceae bacterium]
MVEPPVKPRPAPGKRISFLLAVLIHLVLALLIVYGIHWQTKKSDVIAVDLVRADLPAPTAVPEPKSEPKPEAKPEPKPQPKPEPKPQPKPEPKPAPVRPSVKPDIAQKEKPKPPMPEPKSEPPKDPFKEQLERELKEAEKRKAAEVAAQEAAKELAALEAQQASQARSNAMADYIARIRGKVRGNIVLPADVKGNPEAVFEVTQLPSGEVLDVRLKKSSGNSAWDAATERAIRKSSPLPTPAQKELFSRTLELRFRPLEE